VAAGVGTVEDVGEAFVELLGTGAELAGVELDVGVAICCTASSSPPPGAAT
jgi:hypothetical protein